MTVLANMKPELKSNKFDKSMKSPKTESWLSWGCAAAFLVAPRLAEGAVTFFASPGGTNTNGDLAFQTALGTPFTEFDFEQFVSEQQISTLNASGVSIEIRSLNPDGTVASSSGTIFDVTTWGTEPPEGVPGTIWKNVLTGSKRLEFVFSPPVKGFGAWLFDDGDATQDEFSMTVVEAGGTTSTSEFLDAGNGYNYKVEGFLGAVSSVGIGRVILNGQEVGGGTNGAAVEVDHVQVGAFPPLTIALHPCLTIRGSVGEIVGVQYTTNLAAPMTWIGTANVTLTNITQMWCDPTPANQPQRYYRVVPGPITIP